MHITAKRTTLSVSIAAALLAIAGTASAELQVGSITTSPENGFNINGDSTNEMASIYHSGNKIDIIGVTPNKRPLLSNFTVKAGHGISDPTGNVTVQNNTITLTGWDDETRDLLDHSTYKQVELFGGTAFHVGSDVLPEEKLTTIKNNKVIVKNVKLDVEGNAAHGSQFIGGGEYLPNGQAETYCANANENKVQITDSDLKGTFHILGGGARTASDNTVEIVNSDLRNFDGTLLGGMGMTAKNNRLVIDGGSYSELLDEEGDSLALLGSVGGGNGELLASGNAVELKAGSVSGTFIGGTTLVKAEGNKVQAGGENLQLDGSLIGGFLIHQTAEKNLALNGNTVEVTQFNASEDPEAVLDVSGTSAWFIYPEELEGEPTGIAKDASLSMSGTRVSITGNDEANKLVVGDVIGDSVGVMTTNVPGTISALGATIELENVKAENVHGLVLAEELEDDESNTLTSTNHYGIKTGGITIALRNSEVTGEVGLTKLDLNGGKADVTDAGKSGLYAEGVNRIGSLGNDVKNIALAVSEVNRDAPVITFTSAENHAYSGLNVKASIGELSRVRMMRSAASSSTDPSSYLLFGASEGAGQTNLSGTIEYSGTFTQAAQNFSGSVADGSTLSINDINNGTAPAPVVTANTNAKTLSESLLGSVALINQGSEFIADEGMAAIRDAAAIDRTTAFGAMAGGYTRYETGSHVNVKGGSMALGAATKFGGTTVAGFFELGHAESTAHVADASSDGKHQSYGLGVAVSHALTSNVYLDGSVRAGRSETKFDGYYGSTAEKAHYKARSEYVSAHVGGGYVFNVTQSLLADVYARGIVSHLGSDDVSLGTSSGERLHMDSTTSETFVLGARMKQDVSSTAFWRAGAAWMHVFDGDADSSVMVDGLAPARIESPSLSGNSLVLDVGCRMKPSTGSPWQFDLGLKGYAGDRRGVTGSAQMQYAF